MQKKDAFIQKIQDLYGSQHARILQHLYTKPADTFRVNLSKATTREITAKLRMQKFEICAGPLPNSFVVISTPPGKKLSETDLADQGKIYLQSMSSMLPVLMLDPHEGEKILDLCSAPGSKTSQISQLTNGRSEIVAVDNNKRRLFKLHSNLKTQGVDNVRVIHASGVGLERRYKEFISSFDKILVDAPCSNEGLICLSDPHTFDYWNEKLPKKLAKLQKKLVSSAVKMLEPGGTLVYSTCTFSREENEDVVSWAVSAYPELRFIESKRIIPDGVFTAFFAVKLVKLDGQVHS